MKMNHKKPLVRNVNNTDIYRNRKTQRRKTLKKLYQNDTCVHTQRPPTTVKTTEKKQNDC